MTTTNIIRKSPSGSEQFKQHSQAGPPSPTDDRTKGFLKFSEWIDETAGQSYVCIDDTPGAAVWVPAGIPGGGYNLIEQGGVPLPQRSTLDFDAHGFALADIGGLTRTRWSPFTGPQPPAMGAVNPLTGSDENPGTTALPLATWAEFRRRYEGITILADTTVEIQDDLNEPIEGRFTCGQNGFLRVTGHGFERNITPVGAGTLLAVVAMNPATNTRLTISDAAIPSWIPFLGRRVRWTSGPATDAIAWVQAAVGATAIMSASVFTDDQSFFGYTLVEPNPGDSFVIEDLILCEGFELVIDSPSGSNTPGFFGLLRGNIDSLFLDAVGAVPSIRVDSDEEFLNVAISRCDLPNATLLGGSNGPALFGTQARGVFNLGTQFCSLIACSIETLAPVGTSEIQMEGHTICKESFFLGQGSDVSSTFGEGFACFGSFLNDGLIVFPGSVCQIGSFTTLWGTTGNVGARVHSGGLVVLAPSATTSLTGTVNDTIVGAAAPATWAASLASGFSTTHACGIVPFA